MVEETLNDWASNWHLMLGGSEELHKALAGDTIHF